MSELISCDIVIWLYPESNINEIFNLELSSSRQENLEPVTTYQEGIAARRSERLNCDKEILDLILRNSSLISKNVDSLCLYRKESMNWVSATIGHEGMSLVRDDSLLDQLSQLGFPVSDTAPDWW